MDLVNLPLEKAIEPNEQARQPEVAKDGSHSVTFADTPACTPQDNSVFKDALSQPPKSVGHKQRLLWLQQRRAAGLWAQCDECDRWRHLPRVLDRHELPARWYCWMNPDKSLASCTAAEVPICLYDENDLIHAEYAAGSLVLARLPGFPWWPAMVCDCPDTEQYYWLDGFSDIPTHYNVVFFDAFEVTRAWMAPDQLKPYKDNTKLLKKKFSNLRKFTNRLDTATIQANDAAKLPVAARLAKYSFIARFKGNIVTPKKLKKQEKERYRNILKRKFKMDFSDESTSSEGEIDKAENILPKKKTRKQKNKVEGVAKNNSIINNSELFTKTDSFNNTKDLDSVATQIDDSGPVKSIISGDSNNTDSKLQEESTASDCRPYDSMQTQVTDTAYTHNEDAAENSDDFEF